MSKNPLNKLIKNVAEIRNRRGELISSANCNYLIDQFNKLDLDEYSEIYRYIPVKAIGMLEAKFRAIIAVIIDYDHRYLVLSSKLLKEQSTNKLSDILPHIYNKEITAGELISYQLPFSSIEHFLQPLDILLDKPLTKVAVNIVNPFAHRDSTLSASPIIDDVNGLWQKLAIIFNDRHIIAHESPSKFDYSKAQALQTIATMESIDKLLDAIMWNYIWVKEPLTQAEISIQARDDMYSARCELIKALKAFRKCHLGLESKEIRSRFRRLYLDCKKNRNEYIDLICGKPEGSIWYSIYASTLTQFFRQQIENIKLIDQPNML